MQEKATTHDRKDHHHPVVAATATALPRHHYAQAELAQAVEHIFPSLAAEPKAVERLFQRVQVKERYLALPIEAYAKLPGFGARNDAWREISLEMGERVIKSLLEQAEVDASEVGMIMTTSVTGVAVPSLDAQLMNRIPFPRSTKRIPMFGLGCLAGTAGFARASEYLRAFPCQTVVFLSVELCSLTMQPQDASVASIVSSGLFGDGAAAVLLAGAKHHLAEGSTPRIVDSRSRFFPDTERAMGWDVVDTGFRIALSGDLSELARNGVPEVVDSLLSAHGLTRDRIQTWIAHPAGPAVLDAVSEGLGLAPESLAMTHKSLAEVGNLSSASVLFVLDEMRTTLRPKKGSYGVMLATGPGFSVEAVLLQW
ncbi:MAG: 3-oxoacyl-[acyl-carrier-protein] synthase III C-terminal domain-containing protein [Myxococcales bacterium]